MSETILIVDDERAIAQLTALWIKRAGYDTVTAFDGLSGLATAARVKPRLILLDIRLPDIDGFEVFRRLQRDASLSSVPVIFLSAHAQEAARREAIDSGARGFLSKPYEFKALLAAVTRVLGAKSEISATAPSPAPTTAPPVAVTSSLFNAGVLPQRFTIDPESC